MGICAETLMKNRIGLFACATLICVATFTSSCIANAQKPDDPHAVQPERPTVATHAGTVAPGWFEVEAGVEHDRFAPSINQSFTPIVAKLGVVDRVQFDVFGSAVHNDATTGVGDIGIAIKWRLLENAPLLGDFAIQPSIKFPTGAADKGTGTGTTDGSFLLISSHDLGPVAMDINVGLTRRSGDGSTAATTASVWTLSFGGAAVGNLGWVLETYGYPGTGGAAGQLPIVALLGGPTYLLKPWLAIDAGIIVPITGPQAHALYAGGVYNVGRVWQSHSKAGDTPGAKPSY
jgi:hypothetical protein